MKSSKMVAVITSLVLFVFVSTVLVMNFTFASTPADITAVYTRNNIAWEGATVDADGAVDLHIFGDPEPGEEYPLIYPGVEGTYRFRLRNDNTDAISYNIYLYNDAPETADLEIPLEFQITNLDDKSVEILPKDFPQDLKDPSVNVICAYNGRMKISEQKDFDIHYEWDMYVDDAHDVRDTYLGDTAVQKDLIYNFHILLIIEDYGVGPGGAGSSSVGTSNARMLRRSYVIGREDGLFHPESPITRAEVATIFARIMAGFDERGLTDLDCDFVDVTPELWHAKYIASLETKNVINGYPDGTFKPDLDITRGEFAAVCVRYYEKTLQTAVKPAKIDFSDLEKSHWAYQSIAQAYALGYIKGYEDGTYHPDQKINRSEAVTIVNRMLDRIPDNEYIDNNLHKLIDFPDVQDNTYWAYYDIFEAANTHYIRFDRNGFARWID